MDKKEEERLDRLIDSNPKLQKLIDEINEMSDVEDEGEEDGSPCVRSPFAMEGTIYDGATGEEVEDVCEDE